MSEQLMTEESKNDTQDSRYLSFSLGTEEFGVPLVVVREVIGVPECTPLPFTSQHVMGIMNLRGQVITVIDLRKRLGTETRELSPESAVIICESGSIRIGLMVDSVNAVINAKSDEIGHKPEIEKSTKTEFIASVFRRGNNLVLFLDVGKILEFEKSNAESVPKAA